MGGRCGGVVAAAAPGSRSLCLAKQTLRATEPTKTMSASAKQQKQQQQEKQKQEAAGRKRPREEPAAAAVPAKTQSKKKAAQGKKAKVAFDTPYGGPHAVRIVPGGAEAQAQALAALSKLASTLPTRKELAKAFVVGANSVCRVVEAKNAGARVAVCCVSAPEAPKPGQRVAFGVGTPSEVLARHIALCCAQQHVPVVLFSETDSTELGRVLGVPSALAAALRTDAAKASADAEAVLAKLVAAQATATAPWLKPTFADEALPPRAVVCEPNPRREPQRQARKQQPKKKKQKQQQAPPAQAGEKREK